MVKEKDEARIREIQVMVSFPGPVKVPELLVSSEDVFYFNLR